MAAPKVPTRGGQFAALHTRMLTATDLLRCGDAARVLFVSLILHATQQGSAGYVPADPFELQMIAHLEGGEASCEVARDRLLRGGFLIPDPDGDTSQLVLRTFVQQQAAFLGETAATTDRRQRGQSRRQHLLGKHGDEPRPGCELCVQGAPAVPDTASHATSEPETTPEQEPSTKRPQKQGGMGEVLDDLRADLGTALESGAKPLAVYREGLSMVDQWAANPEVASRSKDALGALRNAVLAHALVQFLGEDVATGQVIGAACRGAKNMGPRGHEWYVLAAAEANGQAFESASHATGFLRKTANSKAREAAEGGAR